MNIISHIRCILVIVVLFFLAWTVPVWAHEGKVPSLTARLDRKSAKIGDIVTLSLRYHLPKGARLPADLKVKGIEGLTPVGKKKRPGEIRIRFLVDRLKNWKTGTISISYLDREGKVHILQTGPVSLTVLSNLKRPADARLRPIQGIIPLRPLWQRYLPWALAILCIALVLSVLFWWYKKRHIREITAVPQDPPHIWARKEIRKLVAQRLFERGHVKEFYFGLSEILRRYLESLRGFPAVECTTEEIARHLKIEQDRELLPLLREADLVKFADRMPTQAEKEREVEMALSYIQETSPSEPEQ
jgi:hypothetical protein